MSWKKDFQSAFSNKPFTVLTAIVGVLLAIVAQLFDLSDTLVLRGVLLVLSLFAGATTIDWVLRLEDLKDKAVETQRTVAKTKTIVESRFPDLESTLQVGFRDTRAEIRLETAAGVTSKFFEQKKRIIEEFQHLTEGVTSEISAVLFSGANSPSELTDVVAAAIKKKRDEGVSIIFQPVIVVDYDNPPPDIKAYVEGKYAVYEREGVEHRVDLRLLHQSPTAGLDVAIFDKKHVVFLIADPLRSDEIYKAVVFEDRPDLAMVLSKWFTDNFYNNARPYQEEKDKLKLTR